MNKGRCLSLVLITFVAMLVLVACGGGSSSSSPTPSTPPETEASGGGETSTVKNIVPPLPETPPTEIVKLPPLPKAPQKGVSTVFLQCDYPICEPLAKSYEEAADALGWKVKTLVYKTGEPQPQMTEAVNIPGVEYIVISSIAREFIEPQMKIAEEKDIQVMSCCDPTVPEATKNWPVEISDKFGNSIIPATSLADYMIDESAGKAHIALVSYPEVPTLALIGPAIKKRTEEKCPECTFDEIPVTGEEEAAGTVPAKVVAYLQAHPDVNFLPVTFGGILNGIPQALKTAGLASQVNISGLFGLEPPEAEALAKEEVSAWWTNGQQELGHLWADAIARHVEGLPLPQDVYAKSAPQHWLCRPATAVECGEWVGPPDGLKQFEALWKVHN